MQSVANQQTVHLKIGQIHEADNPHQCGYCKKEDGVLTWGFVAQKLPVSYYETLMNRGWRRCGTYYYKMDMAKSCCPTYTIKSQVNDFKIKRQQKKTVKGLLNLVGVKKQSSKNSFKKIDVNGKDNKMQIEKIPKKEHKSPGKGQAKKQVPMVSKQVQDILIKIIQESNLYISKEPQKIISLLKQKPMGALNYDILDKIRIFVSDNDKKGDYYSNYVMLLFGSNKKLFKQLTLQQFSEQISSYLTEILTKVNQNYEYNIEHSGYLIFKRNHVFIKKQSEQFQVINKIMSKQPRNTIKRGTSQQFTQIRQSPMRSQYQNKQSKKQQPSLKMIEEETVEWPELFFTPEKIIFGKLQVIIVPVEQNLESFTIYSKYSKKVHNSDKQQMSGYTDFLCLDALNRTTQSKDIQKVEYRVSWDQKGQHQPTIKAGGRIRKNQGCYHMKYFLQGKLIGVGVVDILAQGLSSVYFFYDHNYKDYRLGVFSTLLQIQYTKYINKAFPQFKYYYLGYYIHNCTKMNYKADYEPCLLLCPISYNFITVTKQLRQKLDDIIAKKRGIRLSQQNQQKNPNMILQGDAGIFIDRNVKLSFRNKIITLKNLKMQYFSPVLLLLKGFLEQAGTDIFIRTQFEL